MSKRKLTAGETERFEEDGYLLVDDLIDAEKVDLLLRLFHADQELAAATTNNKNFTGEGLETPLAYRSNLGDDAYSALACSERTLAARG